MADPTVVPTSEGGAVLVLDSDTRYALKTLLHLTIGGAAQAPVNRFMNYAEIEPLLKIFNDLPSGAVNA